MTPSNTLIPNSRFLGVLARLTSERCSLSLDRCLRCSLGPRSEGCRPIYEGTAWKRPGAEEKEILEIRKCDLDRYCETGAVPKNREECRGWILSESGTKGAQMETQELIFENRILLILKRCSHHEFLADLALLWFFSQLPYWYPRHDRALK